MPFQMSRCSLAKTTIMGQTSCAIAGVGKTTAIRELARYLADEVQKRVVLVDTSNEIGGDGDIPHEGVGSARRMQVKNTFEQHKVMIEAVEVSQALPPVYPPLQLCKLLECMFVGGILSRHRA